MSPQWKWSRICFGCSGRQRPISWWRGCSGPEHRQSVPSQKSISYGGQRKRLWEAKGGARQSTTGELLNKHHTPSSTLHLLLFLDTFFQNEWEVINITSYFSDSEEMPFITYHWLGHNVIHNSKQIFRAGLTMVIS